MKGVSKRPVRGALLAGGKKWLWIALPLLLCALAAGAYLLSRAREKAASPDITRAPDPATVLVSRDISALKRVEVEQPTGKKYALLVENGEARLEGDEAFVFSESLLAPILQNAALIASEETILEDLPAAGVDFADFGLDEGSLRVAVTYTDGAFVAFRVGDALPEETPTYYFRVEGDERLYNVSQDVYDAYAMALETLHAVTDPSLNAELIDAIEFSGENAFRLELLADGWHMTEPFDYPLDGVKMDALLAKLEGVRFAQYVGREEKVDLAAITLSPPARTVTLTIAPTVVTGYDDKDQEVARYNLDAYDLAFACGAKAGEVGFYCLYKGEVVKATNFSAGFLLTQGYETLLCEAPFNYPTNALTALTWQRDGKTLAYALELTEHIEPNNQIATDESGNILYDVIVSRDGQSVDGDAFLRAYMAMAQLRMAGSLPAGYEIPPNEAPALAVTLARADAVRRIAFYPYDALHWAVAVNGKALYYVSADWADALALP